MTQRVGFNPAEWRLAYHHKIGSVHLHPLLVTNITQIQEKSKSCNRIFTLRKTSVCMLDSVPLCHLLDHCPKLRRLRSKKSAANRASELRIFVGKLATITTRTAEAHSCIMLELHSTLITLHTINCSHNFIVLVILSHNILYTLSLATTSISKAKVEESCDNF